MSGYLERSRESCPEYRCPGKRGNCNAVVEAKGKLCGRCDGMLEAGIEDLEDRGKIPLLDAMVDP